MGLPFARLLGILGGGGAPPSGPRTLFSDDFVGPDANPIGGNYTTQPGCNANKRLSNTLQPSSTGTANVSYVNSVTPPDDQWAETTLGTGGGVLGLACRMSTSEFTSINLLAVSGSSLWLQDCVAGSFSEISPHVSVSISAGDVLRLEVEGDEARAYLNGVLKISGTTSLTSGRFGVWTQQLGDNLTAFSGGDWT